MQTPQAVSSRDTGHPWGVAVHPSPPPTIKNVMNLTELKKAPVPELVALAQSMEIEGVGRSRKQDLIFAILKAQAKRGEDIYGDGVLEILTDGFGFLRSADASYLAGPDDNWRKKE
jgi:transcription termination factor Rho